MKPFLKAATNPKKNLKLAEKILAIDDDHLRSHVVGEINAGPDRYALELGAGYAKALSGLVLVIPPITIALGGLLASATAQNDEGHQFIVGMARDAQHSIGFFLIASLVLAFISIFLTTLKRQTIEMSESYPRGWRTFKKSGSPSQHTLRLLPAPGGEGVNDQSCLESGG